MAMYLECLAPEALGPLGACAALLQQMDALFRSIALQLPQLDDVMPLLRVATAVLKIPHAAQHKVPCYVSLFILPITLDFIFIKPHLKCPSFLISVLYNNH